MFQLTINEKGGQATSQSFDKNEITIGRVQGNDVVLPKGNISKRHSRIVLKDGKFIIVDLKSTNGTYVNGKKITAPQVIKATDKIYIGDYTLQLANGAASAAEARAPSERAKTGQRDEIDLFGGDAAAEEVAPPATSAKGGSPGLIDDNFDQEFDVAAEAPSPKLPKPAPTAQQQKGRLPPPKVAEPEPELPEEDNADDQELDLAADFPPDNEGDDLSPPPELELDEPAKAPVVPIAAKQPPKKGGSSAPQPRVQNSRAKAAEVKPAAAKAKAPAIEEEELDDEAPSQEMELPDEPPPPPTPPVATARPQPTPVLTSIPQRETPSIAPPAPVQQPVAAQTPAPHALPPPPPQISHPAPPAHAPVFAAMPSVSAAPPMEKKEAIHALHLRVVDELGLRGYDLVSLGSMRDRVAATAKAHAQRMQATGRLDASEDVEAIAKAVASLATDTDLISALYGDDNVVQIVITHDRQIWAEREALTPEGSIISSEDQVIDLIRRLGVLGGADPTTKNPLVDVRLRDGTRVLGVLPPLAFRGPTLSIRKATRDAYHLDSFVESGTLSEGMAKFIDFCIRNKKNMLLSVGSGVTGSATLNALASGITDDERVVTIESGVELHLHNLKNVTALEPNKDVGLAQLVKHAATLQPDHVIIGHMHGPDTVEVLHSLAGTIDGSMASYSASSPKEAIDRMAHVELATHFRDSPSAAKRLIASAFPVILQEHRFPEGASRRITTISEVLIEGEEVVVQDIFVFRPEGIDENGVLNGTFSPTGHEPRFVHELVDRGDEIDMEIFKE